MSKFQSFCDVNVMGVFLGFLAVGLVLGIIVYPEEAKLKTPDSELNWHALEERIQKTRKEMLTTQKEFNERLVAIERFLQDLKRVECAQLHHISGGKETCVDIFVESDKPANEDTAPQ
ncbi:MAG: hypothetical protein OXU73_01060 [Candidatus Campbellbacteria bacterium]|nr:hypothetical protein [Candidatus Campbellbacteria bacterium]